MKEHVPKLGRFLSGKSVPTSDGVILEKKNIVLNCKSVTPEEAIQACGKLMLESGYIEDGYIQAMLDRDNSDPVAVGSHVAIPHGDNESRTLVKKTGLVVMMYPDGIGWNGEQVRLVIGVASRGEEHLEILKRVAAIAADKDMTDSLVDSADLYALYAGLNGLDETKVDRPLLEKRNIVLNCAPVTPEEAIRACGRLLVESGYTSEGYIQGMLERNASCSVAIGSHVAIPHGNRDSLEFVQRTGAAVMTYPDGIQWDDKIVRLVIGIASKGEEHLELLNRIVEIIKSEEDTDTLVANATVEKLYQKLNGLL